MMSEPSPSVEVSVLGAAWRYRWMVAAVTAVAALLALVFIVLRPPQYVAVASVVIEDPAANNILGITTGISGRSVANQLEMFRSSAVAQRGQELAANQGVSISLGNIIRNTTFTSLRDTDVITISYSAEDPGVALTVVQSLMDGYEEIRLEQRRAGVDSVLGRLAAAEEVLRRDLDQVTNQLAETRARRDLSSQIDLVLDNVASIQRQLAAGPGASVEEALLNRQSQLQGQLQALRLAFEVESERPEVAALIRSQGQILAQLGDIAASKSDVEIETEIQGTGVAFSFPPAVAESSTGAGRLFTLIAGAFLGFLVALGAAYALASRQYRFADRFEPEVALGLPFLADVPDFEEAGAESYLPVRDEPRSPTAEAFRFAAGSLELRAQQAGARVVAVVSGLVGEGKSTIVANMAMAAARAGTKVLAVDADFGNQALSRLLLGDIRLGAGLTELIAHKATSSEAVVAVPVSAGVSFGLISRGIEATAAMDVFANRNMTSILGDLADDFELILIDAPPIMQVAYASQLVRLSDATVLVIAHGTPVKSVTEVLGRLEFIEARNLGYVYNRAPVRQEMFESGGSMTDILGDQGFVEPVPSRRSR
jgi:Mrp family chromosome partitioning ATPase/uncharacterized protein involved in exopolysaccharide biosynthesis